MFAAGKILNPKTARSQLVGGMTMGVVMALLEESIIDRAFGDYVNHDLAELPRAGLRGHRATWTATWLDEDDHARSTRWA